MQAEAIERFENDRIVVLQPRHGDAVHGVIAAVGRKWLLVHALRNGVPDGITALRCSHVYSIRPSSAVGDQRWDEVQPLAALGLDTTAGVVARLSALGEIFTLHVEGDAAPFVGTITRLVPTKKRMEVEAIGHGPQRVRFSRLRRIDVGNRVAG